jgi:hypothetical protein
MRVIQAANRGTHHIGTDADQAKLRQVGRANRMLDRGQSNELES